MRLGRTAMAGTLGRSNASASQQRARAAALLSALVFSSGVLADPPRDNHAYKLAPGDRITVTVFGEAELSGDVLIDGAGNIALPFLEPIEVKDLTVPECQKVIRDRLADGILQRPSVSVRVSELRPLYVMGDVRTPGAYPYRYGSTVQGAVASAGGFGPAELIPGAAVSEFLLAEERVRRLSFQKQELLVRRARLEAQRDGMKTFAPPAPPAIIEGTDIAGLVANEKDTFDTHAAILQDQIDLLNSQKPRIQAEIEALDGQVDTAKRQIALVKQHADQYSRLVKQGLGITNTEVQLKLAQASHESELWRLTAQISRLQKDIGDLNVKIQEAEASFKRQIASELRDVRDRLNELDITLPAAREVRDVKLQHAGGVIKIGVKRSISVTRTRNGEGVVFDASETTPLEPGDVVDIRKLLPHEAPHQSASVRQPDPPTHQREAGPKPPVASVSR